jgi:hypothetical protein
LAPGPPSAGSAVSGGDPPWAQGGAEALWLEGGDDPVPGARPEFWPPARGMALAPLLERVDMLILPEEADLDRSAAEA